jgi:predicted nucleic acid-binding protein
VAAFFLDTSAVVKRYVQETGTSWIRNLAAPASRHFLFVARIADVKVAAALARRRRQASLNPAEAAAGLSQFRQDLTRDYRVMEISIPLLQRAAWIADVHVLRAYDAVQLAASLEVRSQVPSLILVSSDADLNTAAIAEGLPVEDPNAHP